MLGNTPTFTVPELLRDLGRADFWKRLVPELQVGAERDLPAPSSGPAPAGHLGESLRAEGYALIEAAVEADLARALASAASTLRRVGLHPVFLYVFDETWRVLDALTPHFAGFFGGHFDVLADVWAWHIDPRRDRGGWLPHRGWYDDVRLPGGSAGLLNVWVSLSEATLRNGCMHVVPLESDPYFPEDLHKLPTSGIALPTAPGTALVWNANVAHWGGTCDPTFEPPRISMSFTLKHPAFFLPEIPALPRVPGLEGRLDLVAREVSVYGTRDLDAASPLLEWARLMGGMRLAADRLRAGREGAAGSPGDPRQRQRS